MRLCEICETKLKFSNTPTFGAGKLKDGGVVCTKCYKQINRADPKVAYKLKRHTLEDVTSLLDDTFGNVEKVMSEIGSLKIDGISRLLGRKEIKELPRILSENESVDNLIQGTYNDGTGLLVSTNHRLIFVDKGILYGLRVEDFPLSKISSIQYETGLLLGKLTIHTSGNVGVIENVDKSHVRNFAEFVRAKIENKVKNDVSQTKNHDDDLFVQLEKLGKLKENGILTETEFNQQKRILLDRM